MSPLTRYLSRLLGVFLLVTAVSEWTQPGLLTVVAPAMVDQPALLWVSGMLTFASGLVIVLGHNVWIRRRRLCRSSGDGTSYHCGKQKEQRAVTPQAAGR